MSGKASSSASLAGSRHVQRADARRPPPPASNTLPPSAAQRIPIDVLIHILTYHAALSPSCAVTALLVSKAMAPSIEQGALHCVSLFSEPAMESFLRLLKQKPERGRRVVALWIAPGRQESDLIATLAPPSSNGALEKKQRTVQALAREILRGCRRVQHLALDGGFLTPQSAVAFGTPCKPTTLLCVNPHSFLGHFSAPLFRSTVRRLEVVDTTLAVEEVDEIRQMLALRHFVWTSPRANADVMRDVSVLLRILAPRARDMVAAVASAEAGEVVRAATHMHVGNDDDRRLLDVLANSGTAPPDKARRNQHLQSICTSTSQARAAALAATFKKVVEDVEVGGGDGDEQRPTPGNDESDDEDVDVRRAIRSIKPGSLYVDSARANSSSLHRPSGVELQTRALSSLMSALTVATRHRGRRQQHRQSAADEGDGHNSSENDSNDEEDDDDDDVVDEWEALRDVVCQRRTANAGSSSRFFAGLGSGPTVVNSNNGAIRSTAGSGVSTPSHGWGVSRAASPTSRLGGGGSSGVGSGAQTPARHDEEVIDGGRALQRVWRRWHAQVNSGELDRFALAAA